ncbi:(+)-neomenthol dehydrogenase, partial [Quercus suber]
MESQSKVDVSFLLLLFHKILNEWAKEKLGDAKSLTEERVDEVLNEFLKDFKEGSLETKGWPRYTSAYVLSKAAFNAYTRIVAKKFPSFRVNCICPGYVKTDINHNTGYLTIDEGAESAVKLVLLPNNGPSGLFFYRNELCSSDRRKQKQGDWPNSTLISQYPSAHNNFSPCLIAQNSAKHYAVVTGGNRNRGIGFETCRQLALSGDTVVLTSRDEKRGLEAVDKLKEYAVVAGANKGIGFEKCRKLASNGIVVEIPSEWAKEVLGNAEILTEERVDEVLNEYLKDFKEGSLETKGWPRYMSSYIISKAAMNAYTRTVAKKFPSFRVNYLCPGYVKIDINHNTGYLTTDEGAERVVKLALLPNDGPFGLFFSRNE